LIGNLAADTIRQFKFDLAVIGCSALDADGDLLDFDIQEVSVSQTIIRQSRKTFLVADHTQIRSQCTSTDSLTFCYRYPLY
jgi:DeoR family glycerol-3-phosphate regulon repressor